MTTPTVTSGGLWILRLDDSGIHRTDPSEVTWYDIGNDLKGITVLRRHC